MALSIDDISVQLHRLAQSASVKQRDLHKLHMRLLAQATEAESLMASLRTTVGEEQWESQLVQSAKIVALQEKAKTLREIATSLGDILG